MIPFTPSDWPQNDLRQAAELLWKWHRNARSNVPSRSVQNEAHRVCQKFDLPLHLVDLQLMKRNRDVIDTVPDLFDYMDSHVGSHALLLAKLAGYKANWAETPVKEFGRAIFLTRSICFLKQDLQQGKHYIPIDVMKAHGVSIADLMNRSPSQNVRAVLWKQIVCARDAYASCKTLNSDLNGWCQRRFRLYWTGGLDLLARVESRKFNV